MRKKIFFSLMTILFILGGCEPNSDLYEELDGLQRPYSRSIEYTLSAADYNAIGGQVASHQAFSESHPAMDYIPSMLSRKFIALNEGSSAMVTYNLLIEDPDWYQAGFGYELTAADYAQLGVSNAFTPSNPASNNLPFFLLRNYPEAVAGDTKSLIYNFTEAGTTIKNLETYHFDGNRWTMIEKREDIPYVGYEMTADDYAVFGGAIAQYNNFSDDNPANLYLPVWLRNKYPYAIEGTEKVIKFRQFSGGVTSNVIAHFTFYELEWHRTSYIETKSEQYVFGALGWAFDPTTRFIMTQSDYMHLAVIDPIPHAVFADFGYYYGASAFFSNFDMRLLARRLQRDEAGNYLDPALGAIFDSEGHDAVVDEMFRRIVEEGLIKVLQNRYPDAVPQSGGIDVHYIVGFETFNDNFSRSYLEAEYRCIASGTPPAFELIEGPRDRQ